MNRRQFAATTLLLAAGTRTAAASPELSRPVLTKDDFQHLGSFALPRQACGHSTAYGESGLAIRHAAGGKLHLLTGSHRNGQDPVYEVEFPGWSADPAKGPPAKFVNEYGTAVYGDAKRIKKGKEVAWTHGLTYDERRNRLYFSFGSWYNIPNDNDPCLAYAQFDDDKIVDVVGGWNAPPQLAHNQKMRGGSLLLPDWFAAQHTGGRRLGVGLRRLLLRRSELLPRAVPGCRDGAGRRRRGRHPGRAAAHQPRRKAFCGARRRLPQRGRVVPQPRQRRRQVGDDGRGLRRGCLDRPARQARAADGLEHGPRPRLVRAERPTLRTFAGVVVGLRPGRPGRRRCGPQTILAAAPEILEGRLHAASKSTAC